MTLRHCLIAAIAPLFAVAFFAEANPAPNPKRFEKAIGEFEADYAANPPKEGAVLCVGSSSMRMWGGRIKDDLWPLTVIPRGFGGSHFSDVLYYFDELVTRYHPRAILIYEGDNDVTSGKSPESILEDFKTFREKVAALDPAIRIYVIGVKPCPSRWHLWPNILKTNALIESVCDDDPRMTFLDVSHALLSNDGHPRPEIYLEDGVHLNNLGYNLWAGAIGLTVVPAESPFENP